MASAAEEGIELPSGGDFNVGADILPQHVYMVELIRLAQQYGFPP